MNYQNLNKLKYLNRDITRLQHRIEELEAFGEGTTSKITGLPSGACRSDKVASAATSLADLKTLLETKLAEAQEEYCTLSTYIESIDDPFIRMIVQDRYINALPWEQIAANMGGGNTANSVRNVHWRYFKRLKS